MDIRGDASDPVVLLEGGSVRTLDPARPRATAVLVRGGRVAALPGDDRDVPRDTPRAKLRGACVLPAFTDAHVHFPSWALSRRALRLIGVRSLEAAVAAAGAAVGAVEAGGWLRGYGWRDELWPAGEAPSRQALDAATGDVPAVLSSHDSHSVWLNSAALARAGGDLETPGGVVERDFSGEPTGVLREEAAWRFEREHAAPGFQEALAAMRAAMPAVAAAGVTAVHDKDGGRGAPALFRALRDEGRLTVRVWQSLPASELMRGTEDEAAARLGEIRASAGLGDARALTGTGDGMLRIGYVKAFMDGTLGSRTARLLDGSGVQITSRARLAAIVRRAASLGLPVAVHAIGDLANREALDAFEETAADWRPRGLRHRIEHAQCVAPEDLPRFAGLGVTASVQFTHATSDRDVAERLWADRLHHAYPYKSLLDAGTTLVGGSDAPIEELEPLAGIAAAVLRTADERSPWQPAQAIGVPGAVEAFTVDPAWLAYEEDRRGRLRPGYVADLVVLDRDPFACPPEELPDVRVVATMLAGRWVHGEPPW